MAERNLKSVSSASKQKVHLFVWSNVIVFVILVGILLADHFTYKTESQPPLLRYSKNMAFLLFFLQAIMIVSILSWYVQNKGGAKWWFWIVYGLYVLCVIYWVMYFFYYEAPEGTPPKELWWTKTGASLYVVVVTLLTLFLICSKYGSGCFLK